MEILIVFVNENLSALSGKLDELKSQITNAAKILSEKSDEENINIKILQGNVPDISDKIKIIAFIYSNKMKHNMGAIIVEFKQTLKKALEKQNILLDKKELEVRVNPEINMEKLMNNIEKNTTIQNENVQNEANEFDYENKSKMYIPVEPLYSFDRVIIQKEVKDKIEEAIGILECENKVFNEWGLYEIQPHPSTSLSFFGPSGTGKTMAAEAVAEKLGKKILKVSYADVESKYHGEGPKMVKAIFLAAKNSDAVLFFDEADSLLSKRLTSVSQGSEQAINSMRSQLLISLEEFRGIVIFATNLIVNYDPAFLTRLLSVEFKKPDKDTRESIWNVHIKPINDNKVHKLNIPLGDDINVAELAEKYDFVGREIRNAVVSACISVALQKRNKVYQQDFVNACEKIIAEKEAIKATQEHSKATEDLLKKAIQRKIEKDSNDSRKAEVESGNIKEEK